MKKRLIPLAILALLVAGATTAVFTLGGNGATAEDAPPINSDEGIDPNECNMIHNITACPVEETSTDQPPIRSDEAIDPDECNFVHNIDACPVEEPSGDQPPIRSDEGIDPNECNQVHNIDACAGTVLDPPDPAIEPSGEDRGGYEVTVRFNTSVTQEDYSEAEAILRAFDDNLEFFIQESFPPTGRAFLETDASDFCLTVERELEAKSYVDSVFCQPEQEGDGPTDDVPGTVVDVNDETNCETN